jgi:hypothetical protein
MAMIAITTSSSINVNPQSRLILLFIVRVRTEQLPGNMELDDRRQA